MKSYLDSAKFQLLPQHLEHRMPKPSIQLTHQTPLLPNHWDSKSLSSHPPSPAPHPLPPTQFPRPQTQSSPCHSQQNHTPHSPLLPALPKASSLASLSVLVFLQSPTHHGCVHLLIAVFSMPFPCWKMFGGSSVPAGVHTPSL